MTTKAPAPSTAKNLIVTIAVYGKDNFTCSQNKYTFETPEDCTKASAHYMSDAFRRNIEAAGAFVKVDCFTF